MQVLDPLFATSSNPYKNEAINIIYNQLFCDNIQLYKSGTNANLYPWEILFSAQPGTDQLNAILQDESLDARYKILASNLLLASGATIDKKELLGVIVEVSLAEGLDVLAAFKDGTARYINHSEKLLVWETKTTESHDLISNLFLNSGNVVSQIGPWDAARKPYPTNGMVRLNFLVSDGLYFGEGPFEVLQKDPLGGPVINSAIALMNYLIDQAVGK